MKRAKLENFVKGLNLTDEKAAAIIELLRSMLKGGK